MKKFLLLISLLFASDIIFAQSKLLTMEEAVVKQKTSLAPARLKQLAWIKNTDTYYYIDNKNSEDVLVTGTAEGNALKDVVSLSQLNSALTDGAEKQLKAFPLIRWKNSDQFTFESEKKLIQYDLKTKKASAVSPKEFLNEAANKDIADKTDYMAYTIKNNLFVFDGNNQLIVTNEQNENIVNGQSVHRDEFGITKGTYWSPSGTLLAFYRMDQTMVTDYPIIDWAAKPAANTNIKYPMAGEKSHEVTVGIYNVSSGNTVFIKTGEPKEQYLTNIAWSPNEQHIYIAVLNREQNHLWLNSYSAVTGLFEKTLFEETHDKYVHPMHPLVFVPNNPSQFIWQSERDGYNHLYLYDISGKLIKQLTKGKWIVTDLAGFDLKGSKAFYSSTAESGITRNFYSVDLKKGSVTKLTANDGTHTITLNSKGTYFLDQYQSTETPRTIYLKSTNGKSSKTIFDAPNPIKDYKLGKMSIFTLKSESGDDLYCRLFKPVDFDSTKKYPTIVYLYNGPGAQMINNTWNGGGDLWFQYMAERGFVVFTIDGRGSANRGLAFEQAIFRHVGVLVGIEYLKSQKYVDANRMGLFGWSYGGFMTTSIMTRYPDIFKAAAAGGPVIDWQYYEIMYTERYMDTPQENPEGYKESRTIDYIDNLKGKLLIIHGTQDPVVVWQHSMMFLKACVDKKKQIDYFVYPGHEHNVLGKDREHLYQKVTDYFMQNL
ncbi:MAG: dipeptidyl aminopeptidase/acylaminoacyl peptidase [Bacteroidetes bacterium]|nr:dipeptidyl aminopeptidase/acylaminoacyl peptidase [Bacteroidota bacterium]